MIWKSDETSVCEIVTCRQSPARRGWYGENEQVVKHITIKSVANSSNHRSSAVDRVPESDGAFEAFLHALDPRGDSKPSKLFRFALAKSRDQRFRTFVERLYRPRYQRWSLAAIARSCDLTLADFMAFWQRAQIDQAVAILTYAAPDVAAGLVKAALPREEVCGRCEGLGWLYVEAWVPPELVPGYLGPIAGDPEYRAARTCPFCEGTGKVVRPGDVKAAGKVLAIAGLVEERAPAVQINQQFGHESHAEAIAMLPSSMAIDLSWDD